MKTEIIGIKRASGTTTEVDAFTSFAQIREANPIFFRKKLGKRETYSMHRGALIIRYTIMVHSGDAFSQLTPIRNTVIYFCDNKDKQLFWVSSDPKNIRQAKKIIDTILDKKATPNVY